MESRNKKIKELLSLIRGSKEHFLIFFKRDKDKEIIVSQTPIDADVDLWFEILPSEKTPVHSEDEVDLKRDERFLLKGGGG